MIYLILLVYVLSELFDSQMDTIKFEPQNAWFQNKWYLKADMKITKSKIINWVMKVPLSFLCNGWHFLKGLRIITIDIITAILIQQDIHINFILIVLGLYVVHGIVWQTFYGYK